MREVHSLILQVGSQIQTGAITEASVSLQGLGSWEASSKNRFCLWSSDVLKFRKRKGDTETRVEGRGQTRVGDEGRQEWAGSGE